MDGEAPGIRLHGQTLSGQNVSTYILEKLGFLKIAVTEHPEDGIVWEWVDTINPGCPLSRADGIARSSLQWDKSDEYW